MERLKKLAYFFFMLIIIGLIIHVAERFFSGTFFGLAISLIGLIGEIIIFAVHLSGRRKAEAGKRFAWKAEHIGIVAIVMIVLGIIIDLACTFFFPDYSGAGNPLIMWGFIVAAIGFFVYAVKEKGFK